MPGGRENDDLIDASDILPTLAALADAKLPEGVTIDGHSFASQLYGQWCLTQYYKTRVVRGQRFKLYSTGEFYDLSEDPLEKHDLAGTAAMENQQARTAHARLQQVLASLPPNAKLPWEFRSISARKIRAEEAEQRLRDQTRGQQ